jgi:hypothetical protein
MAESAKLPCVPTTDPSWKPSCRMSQAGYIAGDTLRVRVNGTSTRVGNALSPYWQGRGMAFLGGLNFENPSGMGSWLEHLPRHVPKPQGAGRCPDRFAEACWMCTDKDNSWEYSHRCTGAYDYILPDIQRDTRAALEAYAAASGEKIRRFEPDDVVIQDRCAGDTILAHGEYGPPAMSFFDPIPRSTKRIFIVRDDKTVQETPLCKLKAQLLSQKLKSIAPDAEVTVLNDSLFADFASMVFGPIFFKDNSSFGLWAAAGNSGTVYSTVLYKNRTFVVRFSWGRGKKKKNEERRRRKKKKHPSMKEKRRGFFVAKK